MNDFCIIIEIYSLLGLVSWHTGTRCNIFSCLVYDVTIFRQCSMHVFCTYDTVWRGSGQLYWISLVARQSRSIRYWYRYVVHLNLCMVSYPYVGLPVQVRIIFLFIPEYMARWYVGYIILHMRTVKTPVVPVNRCNYSWTEGVPSTRY